MTTWKLDDFDHRDGTTTTEVVSWDEAEAAFPGCSAEWDVHLTTTDTRGTVRLSMTDDRLYATELLWEDDRVMVVTHTFEHDRWTQTSVTA